jgi:hypothetical protein
MGRRWWGCFILMSMPHGGIPLVIAHVIYLILFDYCNQIAVIADCLVYHCCGWKRSV